MGNLRVGGHTRCFALGNHEMTKDVTMIVGAALGALAGAVTLPVLVFAVSAAEHWLRYQSWEEFWGLVAAAHAMPAGILLGYLCGWLWGSFFGRRP